MTWHWPCQETAPAALAASAEHACAACWLHGGKPAFVSPVGRCRQRVYAHAGAAWAGGRCRTGAGLLRGAGPSLSREPRSGAGAASAQLSGRDGLLGRRLSCFAGRSAIKPALKGVSSLVGTLVILYVWGGRASSCSLPAFAVEGKRFPSYFPVCQGSPVSQACTTRE